MKKLAYVNGSLVPEDAAAVSVLDYGFLYGYGVFESLRAYNGRIFLLEEHLRRLACGAERIGLKADLKEVRNALDMTLAVNNLMDAYIRVTLTFGVGGPRMALNENVKPSVIVIAGGIPANLDGMCLKGVSVGFSEVRHYSMNPLNGIKTLNYLPIALRKLEAKKRKLDDLIILNEKNHAVEATTSNLFVVGKNGSLSTPRIEDGCLSGITREAVIKLAKKLGIKTVENKIKKDELLKVKEAFLTNSIAGIIPVIRIEKRKISIGRTTRMLQKSYKESTLT